MKRVTRNIDPGGARDLLEGRRVASMPHHCQVRSACRVGRKLVLGIAVGVFAERPLAGRLRVQGNYTAMRRPTGAGRPLFANIGHAPIKLERTRIIATPTVTHLWYRVIR